MLSRFAPIARAAWSESRSDGRERVVLHADEQLAASDGQADRPSGWFDGYALRDSCTALMSSGMSPEDFCVVLVHEFGHLGGHEQTMVPGGVMNGTGRIDWKPCDHDVAPPLSTEAGRYWTIYEHFQVMAGRCRVWAVAASRGGEGAGCGATR